MKTIVLYALGLLFPLLGQSQSTTPVCPDNLIINGDLVQSNPSNAHQDIDNATGFSRIWATGSFAEIYPANFAPVGSPPSPASGTYASCWIANNNSNSSSASYREGFKVALTQTILPNTGTYTLTFDMTCLSGFGVAELGVYGIYNPSNGYSVQPTSFNIPDNMNLFGPTNTVLLGAKLIPTCSTTKNQQTIVINTSSANYPVGGMTHLMFTHSGNSQGGAHYTGFDDFCLVKDPVGCVNSLIINGDLAVSSPTSGDQDIDNATGFSRIWATGSFAEIYSETYAPGGFGLPSPASGTYASCWIANNNSNASSVTAREGFKVALNQTLLPNTGTYNLTFDMACLGGFGVAELGVYGIYNPSNAYSVQPTGFNIPDNMNLFGSSNTIYLNGLLIPNCNVTKNQQTIIIETNNPNYPPGGITHLMFTHSGNMHGGARYMAFDDFCLTPSSLVPPSPCSEVKMLGLECIPDINGDGRPDYNVHFELINSGSIHFSTGCGSIAPTSIVGAGTHAVTIASDGTCFPFKFEYYILNSNQEQCHKDIIETRLPRCGRISRTVGQVNVFPNPVADYVQIRWSTENIPDKLSIRVFNANGIEVQSISVVNGHEGQLELNTKSLSTGLYFIKIEGNNYQIDPIKFVKTIP